MQPKTNNHHTNKQTNDEHVPPNHPHIKTGRILLVTSAKSDEEKKYSSDERKQNSDKNRNPNERNARIEHHIFVNVHHAYHYDHTMFNYTRYQLDARCSTLVHVVRTNRDECVRCAAVAALPPAPAALSVRNRTALLHRNTNTKNKRCRTLSGSAAVGRLVRGITAWLCTNWMCCGAFAEQFIEF